MTSPPPIQGLSTDRQAAPISGRPARAGHLWRWALTGILVGGGLYALGPVPSWLHTVTGMASNTSGTGSGSAGPDESATASAGSGIDARLPFDTDETDATNTGAPATPGRLSYHEGIMRVAPSVVSLFARTTRSTDLQPGGDQQQGSGVIIDAGGLVLTNFHLIDGADAIEVVLSDGVQQPATVLGSDRETDLAVLRIDARDLPAVPIDSGSLLHVGDIVLAIGNPFGVGQTVTQGIVSATGRQVAGGSVWQDFVQIDAAINPGNSGGALIDPLGRLVGVTSAVLRGRGNAQGISFAIPGKLLAQVVPQIIAEGRVRRGWLGIGVDDLAMFPELARRIGRGAVITGVMEKSPAQAGDLRRYDVVTRVNDLPVTNANELLLQVSGIAPGDIARLTLDRGGDELELGIVLGERPQVEGISRRPATTSQ